MYALPMSASEPNRGSLQCLAIEQCLWLNPEQPIDTTAFLKELIAKIEPFEAENNDEYGASCLLVEISFPSTC
jgi:hypothetical protein